MDRRLLIVLALVLATAIVAFPAGGQEQPALLATINELRDRDELPLMTASTELDALADSYLKIALDSRNVRPGTDQQFDSQRLLDDVRDALNTDADIVDAGLIVAYDQSIEGAIRTAILDPLNGSAVLGRRLETVGVATAVVGPDTGWLEQPPGGEGPDIDLAGYTIVVVVTAGTDE